MKWGFNFYKKHWRIQDFSVGEGLGWGVMPDSVGREILEDRKKMKILAYGYACDASSLNPPILACMPLVHWVNLWVIATIK